MLLVEMESLGMPYAGTPEDEIQNSIMSGKIPPSIPPFSPILPLIRLCLKVNPSERPSAQQILQHLEKLAV